MKRNLERIALFAFIVGLTLPRLALAQTYEVPAGVIASGGGTVGVAGSYSITGTVGQSAPGTVSAVGSYAVAGGFWPQAQALTGGPAADIDTIVVDVAGSGDFTTFQAAVNYLTTFGVTKPVKIQVKQGTYTESITIGLISGVSAINTITFEPHPDNTASVVLTYDATDGADNWVVKLEFAQYITFQSLTIQALDAVYTRVFDIVQDADHNNLLDNTLIGRATALNGLDQALISLRASSGSKPDSVIIRGNRFLNGAFGVTTQWTMAGEYLTDLEIVGNTFTGQAFGAIEILNADGPVINENTISSAAGMNMTGIRIFSCLNDVEVIGNLIDLAQGGRGINGVNVIGAATQKVLIANNCISIGGGDPNLAVGIQLVGTATWGAGDYIQVLHNTVHIFNVDANNGFGLYIVNSDNLLTNLAVHNNIFTNTGGGYALYNDSAPTTNYTSSHNDLYATGTFLIRWDGAEFGDLTSFQSTNTGLETYSISADPQFADAAAGNYDLRNSSPAIGWGDPSIIAPPIDFDIAGVDRPLPAGSNPDLGAYENALGTPSEDLPPDAPTGLVAVAGDGQADLSWRSNSEADFLRYRVYQSENQTKWVKVDSTGASLPLDSTRTITSLNNGTRYYFYVTAVDNALNESGSSNIADVTPQSVSGAPTALTRVPLNITSTSAILRGRVNPNGLSTDVSFKWGTTTGYGNTITAAPNPVTGTAAVGVSATLEALTTGTPYHYQVVATSSAGTSYGDDGSFTTPADADVTIDNRVVSGDGVVTFPNTSVSLDFTFSGTAGTNFIEVTKFGFPPGGALPADLFLYSTDYWEINRTGTATDFAVAITLNLGFSGVSTGTNKTDFRLLRRDSGGTGTWTVAAQEAFAMGDSTITFTGISGFSQFVVVTSAPDEIAPQISSTGANPLPVTAGYPVTVTAQVSDDRSTPVVELIYLVGGGGIADTSIRTMQEGSSGQYSYTIPGTDVRFTGLLVQIKAVDAAGNDSVTAPVSLPVSYGDNTFGTSTLPGMFTSTNGIPDSTWRLFSVPGYLTNSSLSLNIGDELGVESSDFTWKVFAYNSNTGSYARPSNLLAGVGYWINQRIDPSLNFILTAGQTKSLEGFEIDMDPKTWYLIGNPFPFDVPFQFDGRFYGPITYDGSGWTGERTTMLPWGGYAVYNRTDAVTTLTLSAVPGPLLLAKTTEPEQLDGWLMHLAARGERYTDVANAIGRIQGASEQLDRFDNPEPPFIDGYITLVMERPEWGGPLTALSSDIRSFEETDGTWDLQLRTKDAGGPIALSSRLEGSLPAGHKVVLMDLQQRAVYDLTAGEVPAAITDYSERYPYYLKVMAGSAEYVGQAVDEALAQLPLDFALAQNYPNPFNPSTRLQYSLTRPAPVSLKVYNLLGQEITTLYEGWQDLGHFEALWDGRDRFGNSVATGIYFAVFRAQGRLYTRKMLLLK